MKTTLLFINLLIPLCLFGQINATVIDQKTKEVIPFVNIWVVDENIGTTSNENGEFSLSADNTKEVQFSAIGFKTKKMTANSIGEVVELEPFATELSEVTVFSRELELVIGKFRKSTISSYFACGTNPWMVARYFEYKIEYEDTPYLDKLRILTESDVKVATFNLRFYHIGENGEPEGYILDENIIVVADKGNKITEVDVSQYNIKFPENGFFVAIEWLIIDSNKHEYTYTRQGEKGKHIGISFEPAIGTVPDESDENNWIYTQGKWKKAWKSGSSMKRYKDKYSSLAIELTLIN